jgi:CheY-like chemotaxis protein
MSRATVLLIDDDVGFLTANAMLLEAAGFEVHTAVDGPSGLAAALQHRPDVIVLDVMMRRPDEGFVIARALRAEPVLAETKVIVVTAAGERYGMVFEPDDQWLPVAKVMDKPVLGDELVREIQRLTGGSVEQSEDRA